MGETVTISAGFASVLRTAYPLISSNIRAGAPQTGHWCGGFSPSWMYPHSTHRHFFIFRSHFGFPGIGRASARPDIRPRQLEHFETSHAEAAFFATPALNFSA